jgi:hypothetical protein
LTITGEDDGATGASAIVPQSSGHSNPSSSYTHRKYTSMSSAQGPQSQVSVRAVQMEVE